jgi:DNA repair exonuclease SbcCD ATPase subunit
MASDYDATEFVDSDFQTRQSPQASANALAGALQRAPTREEVDSRVAEAQQKLAELKRAQEDLERERSALEEVRRRQMEFQNGRKEVIHQLTRGLGLLQEAEFNSRRDAEQMARAMVDLGEALKKVEAVHEEGWTKDNFNIELTRALTAIENARMEWNGARLKFPLLSNAPREAAAESPAGTAASSPLAGKDFAELCRLGLALTWPLALVALLAFGGLVAVLVSRH